MSRSYKKNPVFKSDSKAKKFWKREANKKVRHAKDVSNGRSFKKIGDSYNINDYITKCFTYNDRKWFFDSNKAYQLHSR